MKAKRIFERSLATVVCSVLVAGCVTTGTVRELGPLTYASEDAEAVDATIPRTAMDLLRAAEQAFDAANAAQERGDQEAALRNYTLMLELLIEADLDPAVYYRSRDQFRRILSQSAQQAQILAEARPGQLPIEDLAAIETVGELEIPFPLPERVYREIERIQRLPDYRRGFQAGLDRSHRYAPYIRQELRNAGLPEDLVWLAMVESQFTPKINSPRGAGGMWQFMHSTGSRFDLYGDGYFVDERYDWQKATHAAMAYLKELYEMFDRRWPLAISAYNMGEHGMSKAIAANGGEHDLWRLIETPPAAYRIRPETKSFYAKFLASKIVGESPEHYGFEVNPQPSDSTVRVKVRGAYALSELDRACGLRKGTLRELNPWLLHGVTPPKREVEVAVPGESADMLVAALKGLPESDLGVVLAAEGGFYHTVQKGDTLGEIARLYGTSVNKIAAVNEIKSARRLQIGQKLLIHGGRMPRASHRLASAEGTYRVQRGDTLYDIARRERVTVRQLQEWNDLGRRSRIRVGDMLSVAAPGSHAGGSGEKTIHVVEAGENPATIARRYRVALSDLLAWNNLNRRSTIHVGDRLTVHASGSAMPSEKGSSGLRGAGRVSEPPSEGAEKVIHTVVDGENPSVIAAQYDVGTSEFLAWNGLDTSSVLHVGDEYVVYLPKEAVGAFRVAAAGGPRGERIEHIVAKGQNPTTIARRYGVRVSDLFKWNKWDRTPVLQIGSKVIVFRD